MHTIALTLLFTFVTATTFLCAAPLETENVVLITVDGVRWQEFFTGADQRLLDPEKHEELIHKVVRETPEKRRNALMPFFWGSLAPQGKVFGNRNLQSEVKLKNPHKFSYPGYAEILLGEVLPEIDSNSKIYNPRETVLEYVKRKLELGAYEVAAFASWDVFKYICVQEEGTVFVNAGREKLPAALAADQMRQIDLLQFECLTPWDSVRHDGFTAGLAMEYLQTQRPKLLYLAFDETDDWAHNDRYDRVLQGMMLVDGFLEDLWSFFQSSSQYRDKTTLILTTDHGRGNTPDDWTDHGDIEGAEDVWIAVIGPDTDNIGEIAKSKVIYQNQIAATLLTFLGLDSLEFNPSAGSPISAVLPEQHSH